ncbi:protein huluwa isoform X2 [Periophthalmus magnuspinnatus]|uniref:protein huluwa isoform X2 n=1 Tax=Periophthalmus magnuspinnatus TaxID=409849 RepID=UPI0024367D6A|nr:protein huluwa isoform X2 [Periophthalmus magnuspinnatus]
MSQVHQTTALPEGPVSNLTLVVLLLIPCVVILLLLNCLFLGYKLIILSKKTNRREDTEAILLHSALPGARRLSDVAFPLQSGRRAYMSLSEPVLPQPVTSSRASSKERPGFDHRIRLLRPDGATGSGSLKAPSSIRATSSAASPRLDLRSGVYGRSTWCRSAPVLPRSSDSEAETRVNLVPPNSPMEAENGGQLCSSSPYEMRTELNTAAAVHLCDKMDMECELSNTLSEVSCILTSAVGPGLDSDFGASAGVSLRILSADSDGLSNGVLTSALEWDYYDPCYVKQNNVPKQKHHRPVLHTKQYWV